MKPAAKEKDSPFHATAPGQLCDRPIAGILRLGIDHWRWDQWGDRLGIARSC